MIVLCQAGCHCTFCVEYRKHAGKWAEIFYNKREQNVETDSEHIADNLMVERDMRDNRKITAFDLVLPIQQLNVVNEARWRVEMDGDRLVIRALDDNGRPRDSIVLSRVGTNIVANPQPIPKPAAQLPLLDRLREEHTALNVNLIRLSTFLSQDRKDLVGPVQWALLGHQLAAMRQYSSILSARIGHLCDAKEGA